MTLSAIILAGGKSSRMGRDKGLINYNGKKLIEYSIEACKELVSEMIIATNQKEYERFGLKTVADTYNNTGPLGGIHSGIKASQNENNLVLSCDMPHLTKDLIVELIQKHQNNKISFIEAHGRRQPLIGIYPKKALKSIEENIELNQLSLVSTIERFGGNQIKIDPMQYPKKLFYNMNTPKDLKQ